MAEAKKKEEVKVLNSNVEPMKQEIEEATNTPKRRKAYTSKIGGYTYRQILVRLNAWRRSTGEDSVLLEVNRLGSLAETWLTYGTDKILLEDTVEDTNLALKNASKLRRYLLDRKFKVTIKEN